MTAVIVTWVLPATGYGDDFLAGLESALGGNSHLVTLALGITFPFNLALGIPLYQKLSTLFQSWL